jgi:ubiquinone/menaquinone biosynthesis C-methylase UbiE
MRLELMEEAKRILAPGGKLILVDFERPWDFKSRIGRLSTIFVEILAGQDHFRNGRQFLRQGGLKELLKKEHLKEIERYSFPWSSTCVVVADPI